MYATTLTEYPANIVIDMRLNDYYRAKIDYYNCDCIKTDIEMAYNDANLNSTEKVVYDLVYRKGLTVERASEVMQVDMQGIKTCMKHICDAVKPNCHINRFARCYPPYKVPTIEETLDNLMPYPNGLFAAIDIDEVFITNGLYSITQDQIDGLNAMVDQDLDDKQKALIDLKFRYGYTDEEISETTGLKPEVAHNSLYEAIKILREDVAGKHLPMYGKAGCDDLYVLRCIPNKDIIKYKRIDTSDMPKGIRRTFNLAIGDKYPSIDNISDIVCSRYNWYEDIKGIGKITANNLVNYLEHNYMTTNSYMKWGNIGPDFSASESAAKILRSLNDAINVLNRSSRLGEREIKSIEQRAMYIKSYMHNKWD